MSNMRELEQDARQEVRERWESLLADNDGNLDPNSTFAHNTMSDAFHEIADSGVPIYTWDLMAMAAGDIGLATDTPELGPAFGGEPTPVNIIAANVYERLIEAAGEEWREICNEYEGATQ